MKKNEYYKKLKHLKRLLKQCQERSDQLYIELRQAQERIKELKSERKSS